MDNNETNKTSDQEYYSKMILWVAAGFGSFALILYGWFKYIVKAI